MNKEQKSIVTKKTADLLLISVVTRGKGSQVMNLLHQHGADYAVCTFAEGTIPGHILRMLNLAKTKKELVLAFINHENEENCYQSLITDLKLDQTGHGVAFSVPLCNHPMPTGEYQLAGSLIIVDKNKGEDVLDIFEELGLRGGTLLHAFGGASIAKILFDFPVQPEKEVVFLVTKKEHVVKMQKALVEKLAMNEPNQGVAVSFPINRALGLYSEEKKGS